MLARQALYPLSNLLTALCTWGVLCSMSVFMYIHTYMWVHVEVMSVSLNHSPHLFCFLTRVSP